MMRHTLMTVFVAGALSALALARPRHTLTPRIERKANA